MKTSKLDLLKTSPHPGSSSRDEQSMLSDGGVAIATPKEETGIDRSGGEPGVAGILRKSSKNDILLKNSQGMASFLITMFIMIVIGLIVLGFAQLSRRDQRQSLDRQLSTQAYYAAETGVNDAVKHLETVPSYAKNDCAEDGFGNLITGYDNDIDVASDISYTCVLINSTPVNLEKQGVGFNSNVVFPIQLRSGGAVNSIQIDWRAQDPANTANNCPPAGVFPASRDPQCLIGIIRADVLPYPTGGNPTRDGLVHTQSTFFASPINSLGGSANYVTGGSPQNVTGNCSGPPVNCTLTINTITAGANRFYIRLNSIYAISNVTISANGGGVGNELIGGQAIIDSTGRANDVIKRIQVRVAINSTDATPGFGLQTAESQCKRIGVTPPTNTAVIIGPGAPGNICDPSSPNTSGP